VFKIKVLDICPTKCVFGLASFQSEALLQHLKSENWVFNHVWFDFSELFIPSKNNSGWSYNS